MARHRLLRSVAVVAATAAGAGAGTAAFAQPAAVSDVDKEQARKLIWLGDERFAAGDYTAALEAYRGAHQIMRLPTTGLPVARALLGLGRLVEARDQLTEVVDHVPTPDEHAALDRARQQALSLRDDVEARIPELTVTVTGVDPTTAVSVAVDGVAFAGNGVVDPGEHRVTASAPGYEDQVRTVVLPEGRGTRVELVMHARSSGDLWPMVYLGYPVAGAALVVAGVTGGLSLTKAGDFDEACPDRTMCPASSKELRDDALLLAHVSTASFVVAGLGAAVGTFGLVWMLTEDDAEVGVVVRPMGLGLEGRF